MSRTCTSLSELVEAALCGGAVAALLRCPNPAALLAGAMVARAHVELGIARRDLAAAQAELERVLAEKDRHLAVAFRAGEFKAQAEAAAVVKPRSGWATDAR